MNAIVGISMTNNHKNTHGSDARRLVKKCVTKELTVRTVDDLLELELDTSQDFGLRARPRTCKRTRLYS